MEDFTDEDAKTFLCTEWRAKIDAGTAVPYLFKLCVEEDRDRVCVLVTDTKSVWFEALDKKQVARRWRRTNPSIDSEDSSTSLRSLHTPPSLHAALFSISEHPDADLAVQVNHGSTSWTWECVALGRSKAAALLSTHLIMPLLSVAYLAFSNADSVSELEAKDLEQAVDRVGKAARRARDVHVRQTLARPRVSSTLQRMTAVVGFVDPAPPIVDEEADENGDEKDVKLPPRVSSTSSSRPSPSASQRPSNLPASAPDPSQNIRTNQPKSPPISGVSSPRPKLALSAASGSATEPESDGELPAPAHSPERSSPLPPKTKPRPAPDDTLGEEQTLASTRPTKKPKHAVSSSSSSPLPAQPKKKRKAKISSSSESESALPPPKKKMEKMKSSSPPPPPRRAKPGDATSGDEGGQARARVRPGVRQPLKRGGRRF